MLPPYTYTLSTVEWKIRWSQWMKLFSSSDEVDPLWYKKAEGARIEQIKNNYYKEIPLRKR